MHTKISSDNPCGHGRRGFAWECVEAGASAHLDFGCNDGTFIDKLKDKHIGRLVGVDVSSEAIERGKRRFADLEIMHIRQNDTLPFDDGAFDSITIMDVLEHTNRQTEILIELRRVLNDDGTLIVTVPGKHIFSFLDMGNFKFLFPRLHRWFYRIRHSSEEYERRYVSNPDGLVGDVSADKRWHEHFSRRKLGDLLERNGFTVTGFDGTGFFIRLIRPLAYLFRWCKPLMKVIRRLETADIKAFESANLFCTARKHKGKTDTDQRP